MDTVAQIEALGRRAIAVNRDLAVEPGVLSLLAECANELAPVSCVVNNASLFEYDNVDAIQRRPPACARCERMLPRQSCWRARCTNILRTMRAAS